MNLRPTCLYHGGAVQLMGICDFPDGCLCYVHGGRLRHKAGIQVTQVTDSRKTPASLDEGEIWLGETG